MLKGFREFIMRGNVVDLAVAFVIGAAFVEVVKALHRRDHPAARSRPIFGEPNVDSVGTFTISDAQLHASASCSPRSSSS